MSEHRPYPPTLDPLQEPFGVDRNVLISLLGGKRRVPPTLHISEPEMVHANVAHELQFTARNYRATFASRQPRLAALGDVAKGRGAVQSVRRIPHQPAHRSELLFALLLT